jgi:hypothetical protein
MPNVIYFAIDSDFSGFPDVDDTELTPLTEILCTEFISGSQS